MLTHDHTKSGRGSVVSLTRLELQYRFGGQTTDFFQVVCPQSGTAVLEELSFDFDQSVERIKNT